MVSVVEGHHREAHQHLSVLSCGGLFAPDWCFGLFKRLFKRTVVGSLASIAEVVQKSGRCNEAQLVVDETGSVIVPTYDWVSFFAPRFKKLPSIKKGHHFRFFSSHPGAVFTKERADDTTEVYHNLLKEGATFDDPCELPDVIQPAGLSAQRQWYLYEKIREFCPVTDRDLTCPLQSHHLLHHQHSFQLCPLPIILLSRDHGSSILVHGASNLDTTPGLAQGAPKDFFNCS